jgi:hypothetical protein
MKLTLIIFALTLSACADDGCSYTTTRYNTRDILTGEYTSILCSDLICPNQPVNRSCRAG